MLSHYLRSAWRTIRRNPFYSLVNIGCLAIGIAVCMTILLYVLHEHSYDKWQKDAGRIFGVSANIKFGDVSFNTPLVTDAVGPMVLHADGHVKAYLRIYTSPPVPVRNPALPEKVFANDDGLIFVDSNFFQFFSYRLLRGNPAEVLKRPKTVVLSKSIAKKYFGDEDPIGRTIRIRGRYDLEVTGIAADPPSNSGISFHLIASLYSMASMGDLKYFLGSQMVQAGPIQTWLLLDDPQSAGVVERTLDRLAVLPNQPPNARDAYSLLSLADHHLDSLYGDPANAQYRKIFPVVAGLILLLALVNYMSLATARAAGRAKEVGIRKVVGAGRRWIAGQFYTESALFALSSFVAGIVLFLLFRPIFLGWLQVPIDPSFLASPRMLLFSGFLLLFLIAAAGAYPSLVLSAFRPVAVLYGKMSRKRGGERVRKGFIVFQFTISMTLILSCVIIEKELYFVRHSDTGMDRENVLMVSFGENLKHPVSFKRDVAALPGVRQTALADYPLYSGVTGWAVNAPGSPKEVDLSTITVDSSFIPMLGLQWTEHPRQDGEIYDGRHLVLNEAAVKKLGLTADPIGQQLRFGRDMLTIAGILKDFNYESLQKGIGPLSILLSMDTAGDWGNGQRPSLFARLGAHTNIPTTVEAIRKIFREYDKESDFVYRFADEAYDNQYKAEDRLAGLLGIFTVVTIVIACLGLFALATFAAEHRVKEIGIRKVLGASVASVGLLLSRDFLRPVLLAVLIACPVSWWIMNRWLQDFAYRTTLSWWVFVAAGAGLLGIALVTVLARSLRAGRANPIDNLRRE